MAGTAKSDEVFFHIASQKASRLPMMDLELIGNPASLAMRDPEMVHRHPDRRQGPKGGQASARLLVP
jgi:hypothetical protein